MVLGGFNLFFCSLIGSKEIKGHGRVSQVDILNESRWMVFYVGPGQRQDGEVTGGISSVVERKKSEDVTGGLSGVKTTGGGERPVKGVFYFTVKFFRVSVVQGGRILVG